MTQGAAALAGVMYQIANGTQIPNLGEKFMAVMTPDGEIRGYSTQVADVTSTLQSVRAMLKTDQTVIFDSEGSFVLNKVTGSMTPILDDGTNFVMESWIIPPDQVDEVMKHAAETGFGRPAP